jgi:hypothetical protein
MNNKLKSYARGACAASVIMAALWAAQSYTGTTTNLAQATYDAWVTVTTADSVYNYSFYNTCSTDSMLIPYNTDAELVSVINNAPSCLNQVNNNAAGGGMDGGMDGGDGSN